MLWQVETVALLPQRATSDHAQFAATFGRLVAETAAPGLPVSDVTFHLGRDAACLSQFGLRS